MTITPREVFRAAGTDLATADEVADRALRAVDHPQARRDRAATYPWRVALANLIVQHDLLDTVANLADWDGARVLDAGCGPGVIDPRLLELGAAEVTALDSSETMLAAGAAIEAFSDERIRPMLGDLADPALELGVFDVVFCGDVPATDATLDALERRMRSGGRLLWKFTNLAGGCRIAHDRGLELRGQLAMAEGMRRAGSPWSDRVADSPIAPLVARYPSSHEVRSVVAETTGPLPELWSRLHTDRFASFEGPFQLPFLSRQDREALLVAYDPTHPDGLAHRPTAYCAETVTVVAITVP